MGGIAFAQVIQGRAESAAEAIVYLRNVSLFVKCTNLWSLNRMTLSYQYPGMDKTYICNLNRINLILGHIVYCK